ncbi:MAG: phenylalanine--tRNA ligase subunit beta, partial [Candidatus Dormibacteraeota bacterium]|nr:phenylalanine--tRNA ligase subunit beta [Candidatus Dormibacteraeota bacterium]
MRISYEWLSDFVDTAGITPQAAADLLTMSGTKIESLEGADLSGILVGRVLEQREHPRSQKPLWIHQVEVGAGQVRQIIAGAPNAVPGSLVPVALPGTIVPSGTAVRDGKIAGEAAQGMLCSAAELNLGDDHGGILLLQEGEPGMDLSVLYPVSAILVAEVTPNRPDCLGHLGVARELAAAAERELKWDFMPPFTGGIDPAGTDLIRVLVESPDLCRRYIGAPISGVRVAPSPDWLQRRLRAAGVRPISNVVDVTAYVMLEYGQPLHVFDLATLAGAQIKVRRAHAGEDLLCLDGQRRSLSPEMLVIADAERPVAIAGVIGGSDSGVKEGTSDVLLEAATFDGISVRATSRALHLRTEASSRFEKDLSPELALAAARRAATLIHELTGGRVHRDWADEYPRPQEPVRVSVEPAAIDRLLGVKVPQEESQGILRRLGFHVRVLDHGEWDVLPPVFRLDVAIREDIVEEIGRIHGIERIPPTLPGRRRSSWTPAKTAEADWRLREVLLGAGFDETVSPALVSGRLLQRLGLSAGARTVTNPMSDEADTMRTSLLLSLLEVLVRNQDRSGARPSIFEMARVYSGTGPDGLAVETIRLTALART